MMQTEPAACRLSALQSQLGASMPLPRPTRSKLPRVLHDFLMLQFESAVVAWEMPNAAADFEKNELTEASVTALREQKNLVDPSDSAYNNRLGLYISQICAPRRPDSRGQRRRIQG